MQDICSSLQVIDAKIGSLPVEELARATGFVSRTPRKPSVRVWLHAICLLAVLPVQSLRSFAWLLGIMHGGCLSKQNVTKRMRRGFEEFLRQILGQFTAQLAAAAIRVDPCLRAFGRIIVQDSTIVALPAHLVARFPGSKNQSGKPIASMRIQAFVDLLTESCLGFSIAPFTRNDQKSSADILDLAQPGDLIIRDLGYSSFAVFDRLKRAGIHFISRLRYGVNMFDTHGKPLDLLRLLSCYRSVDMLVQIGDQARITVRLVATPVPDAVAAERRRKARLNRDRRAKPSDQSMRLMGWQILITSVAPATLSAQQILTTYTLRWRIETMFKAWKSHFRVGTIPATASESFVCALVLARLLYVGIFQCVFLALYHDHLDKGCAIPSPMKLASLMHNLTAAELYRIVNSIPPQQRIAIMLYYCQYDRRSRPNYFQIIANLSFSPLS